MYVDYLCPFCGQFEATNSESLRTMVESGAATLEVHPIAILTNKSAGTQYSLRAANAAACVADTSPDSFFDFNALLFENQPEEGTTGLTNDEIKALADEAGVVEPRDHREVHRRHAVQVVGAGRHRLAPSPSRCRTPSCPRITGTPTVLVNGQQYGGSLEDPQEFQSFVLQATSATFNDSESTPTPTPTPRAVAASRDRRTKARPRAGPSCCR